jgi:membrane protein implicated in regulation of membrane protease activity
MVLEISIYLLITLICGILLIVMALFGFDDFGGMDFDTSPDVGIGHFEAGHGDMGAGLSPLSLPMILSFGTSFGAFGLIFTSMEWNPVLVPIVAALISLGISAIIFFLLVKVFIQTQANTQVRFHLLVGKDAEVTIPIKPGETGQILIITDQRGRTLITAKADDEISTGTIVTIQEFVGSTAVVRKKTGLVV